MIRKVILKAFIGVWLTTLLGCAASNQGGGGGGGVSSVLPWRSAGLKIGYIRSDEIMKKYGEYKDADNTLRRENNQWLDQAENMEKEITRQEKELEELNLILSSERKTQLESEIIEARKNLQKFRQETWYDENSLYIKRRMELMEPIDTRVNNAIWTVAEAEGFDIVFDSIAGNIVYVKPEFDLTDKVLAELEE
jgi:outer membrane protein